MNDSEAFSWTITVIVISLFILREVSFINKYRALTDKVGHTRKEIESWQLHVLSNLQVIRHQVDVVKANSEEKDRTLKAIVSIAQQTVDRYHGGFPEMESCLQTIIRHAASSLGK